MVYYVLDMQLLCEPKLIKGLCVRVCVHVRVHVRVCVFTDISSIGSL